MLSKRQIILIRSLQQSKYRDQSGLFLAEGDTLVRDLIASGLMPQIIVGTPLWMQQYRNHIPSDAHAAETDMVEMKKISALSTPSPVLGVFPQPALKQPHEPISQDFLLYLDGIRDPGNMGTLLRTADWFGIQEVVFSPDCADPFNPKTVQASMGSIARIQLRCSEPLQFFNESVKGRSVLGALLEGDNIHTATLTPNPILIIGNEAHGIRPTALKFVSQAVTIPSYSSRKDENTAESLNAAIAAGIAMAVIRQRTLNTMSS